MSNLSPRDVQNIGQAHHYLDQEIHRRLQNLVGMVADVRTLGKLRAEAQQVLQQIVAAGNTWVADVFAIQEVKIHPDGQVEVKLAVTPTVPTWPLQNSPVGPGAPLLPVSLAVSAQQLFPMPQPTQIIEFSAQVSAPKPMDGWDEDPLALVDSSKG